MLDTPNLAFKIGQTVTYGSHGTVKIGDVITEVIAGSEILMYVLKSQSSNDTIKVPVAKAVTNGMKALGDKKELKAVLATLAGKPKNQTGMWNRRAEVHREKLNSGDLQLIAEVIRDLHREKRPDGTGGTREERSYSELNLYEDAFRLLLPAVAAINETTMTGAFQFLCRKSDRRFEFEPTSLSAGEVKKSPTASDPLVATSLKRQGLAYVSGDEEPKPEPKNGDLVSPMLVKRQTGNAAQKSDEVLASLQQKDAEISRLRLQIDALSNELVGVKADPRLSAQQLEGVRAEKKGLSEDLVKVNAVMSRRLKYIDSLKQQRQLAATKVKMLTRVLNCLVDQGHGGFDTIERLAAELTASKTNPMPTETDAETDVADADATAAYMETIGWVRNSDGSWGPRKH